MQLDISTMLTPQVTTIIYHHMKKVLLKEKKKKIQKKYGRTRPNPIYVQKRYISRLYIFIKNSKNKLDLCLLYQ